MLDVVADRLTVIADVEHDVGLDLDGAPGRQGPDLDVQAAGDAFLDEVIRAPIYRIAHPAPNPPPLVVEARALMAHNPCFHHHAPGVRAQADRDRCAPATAEPRPAAALA